MSEPKTASQYNASLTGETTFSKSVQKRIEKQSGNKLYTAADLALAKGEAYKLGIKAVSEMIRASWPDFDENNILKSIEQHDALAVAGAVADRDAEWTEKIWGDGLVLHYPADSLAALEKVKAQARAEGALEEHGELCDCSYDLDGKFIPCDRRKQLEKGASA